MARRVNDYGADLVQRHPDRFGFFATLALPDVDYCENRGFGFGPSTLCVAPDKVQGIHHEPWIIDPNAKTPHPKIARDITPDAVEVRDKRLPAQEPGREIDAPPVLTFTHEFRPGVVITTCAGREENLRRTVANLMELNTYPEAIVVVYDGCPAQGFETPIPVYGVEIPKHAPGQEQPRNVGFQRLRLIAPECNYVWFLDSDLIFEPSILTEFYIGLEHAEEDRILIGPYDWLAPGVVERHGQSAPDPRWVSFNQFGPEQVFRHDLSVGLACFGGNLVYPVAMFEAVGGFHRDLHHGRCEDGELGMRATQMGLPTSFVKNARGWHVWHSRVPGHAEKANLRDVPLLNAWHEWAHEKGLVMTDQDGARFNWRCPECLRAWLDGQQPQLVTHPGDDYNFFTPDGRTVELPHSVEVNSLEMWEHLATHRQERLAA